MMHGSRRLENALSLRDASFVSKKNGPSLRRTPPPAEREDGRLAVRHGLRCEGATVVSSPPSSPVAVVRRQKRPAAGDGALLLHRDRGRSSVVDSSATRPRRRRVFGGTTLGARATTFSRGGVLIGHRGEVARRPEPRGALGERAAALEPAAAWGRAQSTYPSRAARSGQMHFASEDRYTDAGPNAARL
mmetsp:Transcript_8286/g.34128  ORF Transcript_8286/g.34128 Transcript_8286/m.34128 type:complete len:189 (+) Transcript_8286:1194-1760(+)